MLFGSQDELDILEALIESNRQRNKNGEQIGREYDALKRVYHERDSRQGANQHTGASVKIFTEAQSSPPSSPPSRKAAEHLGVSHMQAEKAASVVDAIDSLEAQGKKREASQLRSTLNNQSVHKAYTAARFCPVLWRADAAHRGGVRQVGVVRWREMAQNGASCAGGVGWDRGSSPHRVPGTDNNDNGITVLFELIQKG